MKSQMRLTRTSGSVGGLGGRPPRSTRPVPAPGFSFLLLQTVDICDGPFSLSCAQAPRSLRGDILLEIVQDSPDDRGTLRVRLEQILDKPTSGQGVASSPEAGCGAQPASDRQVRIPDLIKIGREDELEMSGRKKVPSRGRTIASHLCEHPSLRCEANVLPRLGTFLRPLITSSSSRPI